MTTPTTTTDQADDSSALHRPTIVKNAASSYFSAVDLERDEVLAQVGDGRYPHTALFHPTEPVAYLLYISSAHLEVLDLETLETVQRIEDMGTAPVGSALGPEAEYFFAGTAVDMPGTEDPGLMALSIDEDGLVEHASQREISRCSGMRIGPNGDLHVGRKREREVVALSADADLEVQQRYAVGEKPHDMYVLEDEGLIVVNNSHESFASFIDVDAGEVIATAETGENPHGFNVAESATYRYGIFPGREDDRVAVVDLEAAAAGEDEPTEALIDIGSTSGFAGTTPDGRYALLDSYDDAYVRIIDLETLSVAGRVEVGGEPLHVVFDDDGQRCFVGNMERTDLAVLDTAPLADRRPEDVTVARRIAGLGEKPSGIFRPEVDS